MKSKTKNNKKYYSLRYLPKRLTRKDAVVEKNELDKSRNLYKKNTYYNRKKINSFTSKVSKHVLKARNVYGIENIYASNELAKKTGCNINALDHIEKKGRGAYFSSGSRPNQTAHSWGRARLASSITGGKSAAVDFNILDSGCNHKTSKAYKMALQSVKKNGHGTRRVPKTKYIKK